MNEHKLDGKTPDMAEENIERIKAIFPDVFEEGKIDFEKLKQDLGEYVDDDNERYNFTWNGKGRTLRLAQTPSTGTLRPCKEESKDWDKTQNLYIEGDNLEVLKLLQKSYHRKIKMIYIDPPYNTGNDFIYPDNYKDNIENYKKITGQIDGEGNSISTNSESKGRYHTDWLNMMYPRLRLARNLISDDGVIFVSIDDNEQDNLKRVCNQIFGEDNFVATFPWRKRTAKSDVPFGVSQDYEWVLCYAKTNSFIACIVGNERKYYVSPDFPNRPWRIHDMSQQKKASERPNSFFDMVDPKTGKVYRANPNAVWRITKDTFKDYYNQNRIVFPDDYDFLNISKPVLRYFKEDDEKKSGDLFGYTVVSTKFPDTIGFNQDGTKDLEVVFNNKIFNFPKPVSLIKFLISISTNISKDAIILDFFSGSSTTAHAVMQLNAEDGGNRKFIMVQLPEPCDEKSEAYKAGYKNICEIGKERIRRAGEKIKKEACLTAQNLDIGFKVFKLDSSNIKKWQPDYDNLEISLTDYIDNYVEERTELDVVYEIMLKCGLDLTYKIDEYNFDNQKVYSIGYGALMICLDDDITTAAAKGMVKLKDELKPEIWRVVFKDNGFKDDSSKTNIKEILKSGGLDEDSFITL